MYLPPFYVDSPNEYLRDVTKCLEENHWIFNFQITNYFGNKTWEKVPVEWREPLLNLSTEELNDLPYNFYKEDWPESLKSFLRLSHRLSLPRKQSEKYPSVEIDKGIKRGMIPKKIAEVSCLAAVVDAVCQEGRCERALDVGAGLGYLGQVLGTQFGRNVIGLELKDNNTEGAKLRRAKQGSTSKSRLYTVELKDDLESRENLQKILQTESRNLTETATSGPCTTSTMLNSRNSETVHGDDGILGICDGILGICDCVLDRRDCVCETTKVFKENDDIKTPDFSQNDSRRIDGGFCMIGLHCCGDLTPTMLKIFGDVAELTRLVCLSCCYHNMDRSDDNVFRNFPMSGRVRDAVCSSSATPWCSQFAFRLAAQETRARWKHQTKGDHEQHTRHVAYRGILQEFVGKGDNKLKKIKRKVARKSAFDDFGSYLDTVLDRTEGIDVCNQRQELLDLYVKYEDKFKYIEPITALQVVLQPVIESLITIDRVLYLNERGIDAEIVPLFNEFISPRNLAIIAKKS